MTTSIIASYNDVISVSFRSDAWFNATAVAAIFGKMPKDWLKNDDTKSYIEAIRQILLIDENQLVSVKRGSPENGGGTWMHPKLGIPFARWLDPKFGVWCDMQVEQILHKTRNALVDLAIAPHQQHALQVIVARKSGTNGAIRAMLWSRFNNHFKLGSYKQLPAEKFDDAVNYLEGIQTAHDPARIPGRDKVYDYPRSLLEQRSFMAMDGKAPAPLSIDMLAHVAYESPTLAMLREMNQDGHRVEAPVAEQVALREGLQASEQALRNILSLAWSVLGQTSSRAGQF